MVRCYAADHFLKYLCLRDAQTDLRAALCGLGKPMLLFGKRGVCQLFLGAGKRGLCTLTVNVLRPLERRGNQADLAVYHAQHTADAGAGRNIP